MSTLITNFNTTAPYIKYDDSTIDIQSILQSIVDTNNYIIKSYDLFDSISFDLFSALNQRNISGTIGEIFKQFFCINNPTYTPNPHPDGRPDIINLESRAAQEYYKSKCINIVDDRIIPIKSTLAPFRYGGIEVKCTIGGTPSQSGKNKLFKDTGNKSFEIGISRIKYIPNLNWGSHHRHPLNLLGLYYDYYPTQNNNFPQIVAAFFSYLEQDDWRPVSTGSSSSKTTSATSLTTNGVFKMKSNCIIYINDDLYIQNFRRLNINI